VSSLAADASPDGPHGSGAPRLWQNLWVRLAVALAFADASIVVLALPQIVDRLHTTISHSTWVIMAYNLALIVTSALVATAGRRLPSTTTLVAGLIIFGLASIGCGASGSLGLLIALRCVQGVGGALVLAASLPVFAGAARPGDSPLHGWSAAAAIGAAIGPAAGGVLTQLFDWRSIFFAQAPVAAVAAVAVMIVRREAHREIAAQADRPPSELEPVAANLGLLLLSASLIGALFLVVIELINAWQLTPIGAAAVVSAIPLSTAATERLVRGRSAVLLGATGAVLLALGLVLLALPTHRQVALAVIGLVLCGAGLGLAYPGLTAAALQSGGSTTSRAAKTVAARDLGLVIGLLILTPVFVTRLNSVINNQAPVHEAEAAVIVAPLSPAVKGPLIGHLLNALNAAGTTNLPDVDPVFAAAEPAAGPADRAQLAILKAKLDAIVAQTQGQLTHSFRRPFAYAAIFALLVLPLLALRRVFARHRDSEPPAPATV
jgi:predicted MFS family arabinose efflux permease